MDNVGDTIAIQRRLLSAVWFTQSGRCIKDRDYRKRISSVQRRGEFRIVSSYQTDSGAKICAERGAEVGREAARNEVRESTRGYQQDR